MANAPTQIGTVQDVAGSTVRVVLDDQVISGLAFVDGQGYRIGQVGSFVRIPMGYVDQFGIVSQIGAGAVPESLVPSQPYGNRWMSIQLVGEGNRSGEFVRGLSQYPTIGDQVHLVTQEDLARIYGRPDSPRFVSIGRLASAESIPALIDIDSLVTRHSAVVGTTGAGKTTTVVGLVDAISNPETFPSARVLILDIHGEYAAALQDRATVFRVNASAGEKPLFIPYWALTFEELLSLTFGSLDDSGRAGVLDRVAQSKLESFQKKPRDGVTEQSLTVDTPIPFSIHKLWFDLYEVIHATHTATSSGQSETTRAYLLDNTGNRVQAGDPMSVTPPKFRPQVDKQIYLSGSPLNIRRQLESLASKLRDPRYDFLFRPGSWGTDIDGLPESDLDGLLAEWVGGDNAVSILDLSGIPGEILTTLIGALLRVIFDALFWARNLSEGGRERPLLVVLEEAHTYLNDENRNSAAMAVKRIVKEGRKYGIGAMIVSQRPSEIDTTVLSQCGTIIALRLTNPQDRSHVTGAVSDNLEGFLGMLPILRTGEGIVIGEAVRLPIRALIEPPPRRPDSYDPLVAEQWRSPRVPADYADVVSLWRAQRIRSGRSKGGIPRRKLDHE